MQSLVAYKCTSSKNKGDPATLLSIGHKDRVISEWCSWAFSFKKNTWKSHVTLATIMRRSNVVSFLHIYRAALLHIFEATENRTCCPASWREFNKSWALSPWSHTLVFEENASLKKAYLGWGVLKWTSSKMLFGDSGRCQRKLQAVPRRYLLNK